MPWNRGKEIVSCRVCSRGVKRSGMSRHFKKLHGILLMCWRCGKEFQNDEGHRKHMRGKACENKLKRVRNTFKNTIVGDMEISDVIQKLITRHVKSSSRLWQDFKGVLDFTNLEAYDYENFLSLASDEFAVPLAVFESVRLADLIGDGETFAANGSPHICKDPSFPSCRQVDHDELTGTGYVRVHLGVTANHCGNKAAFCRTFVSNNNAPVLAVVNNGPLASCEAFIRHIIQLFECALIITICLFKNDAGEVSYLPSERKDWLIAIPYAIGKVVIYRDPSFGLHIKGWKIIQTAPRSLTESEYDPFDLFKEAEIPIRTRRSTFNFTNDKPYDAEDYPEDEDEDEHEDITILPTNPEFQAYLNSRLNRN